MQTWIALLRGINVGGNNVLPMKDLRVLLEGLGLQNVRTYIQSGNCVFEAGEADESQLAGAISAGIEKAFGFRPEVMVLTVEAMKAALAGNPYPEGMEDSKSVHLYFLSHPAADADMDVIGEMRKPSEHFTLSDRVFYLHAPEGVGRSKLAGQVEKALRVPVTARNLRTALKIVELAEQPA
tara:strand:- start:13 stop:555 length:543 start_codon:yes stop_codon:yes gene_type:complete